MAVLPLAVTTLPISILTLLERHPLLGGQDTKYAYGTAGFRYKADHMEGIVLRVGICCALLLKDSARQENMGIMLTASHNDESYNGVKVSNPDGSMIDSNQEAFLVEWVNQRDVDQWKQMFQKRLSQVELTSSTPSTSNTGPLKLHVGRDTRSHSPKLATLMIQGATETMNLFNNNDDNNDNANGNSAQQKLQVLDHGILTTPMLHHIVLHSNPRHLPALLQDSPCPTREGYLDLMAQAYCDLMLQLKKLSSASSSSSAAAASPLQIDCACGVGYDAVQQANAKIMDILSKTTINAGSSLPPLQAFNGPTDGPLNTNCGSEHVQKQLQPPTWYGKTTPASQSYCCSVDGDADRIVFFASNDGGDELTLLDGDKIAVLLAQFMKRQNLPSTLTMGVVQTAYANGASTEYLKNTLNIPVIITKTGVKHLHHAAVHNFDVGIYFEANGHGTVIFGPKFYDVCSNHPVLSKVAKLINPAVGDALSDLLIVDLILMDHGWTLKDWSTQLYNDLPSRQLKVKVKDRSVVKCNDNETKCIAPASLQPALETLMAQGGAGYRCFVRASGTENVVRVYAEAPTRDEADTLASAAARLVQEHCGGVEPLSAI